jgi:hypothetical protein
MAALAVVVGGLVLGSQFIPSLGQEELAHVGDLQVVGWNPANAFKSTITNSDGTFNYDRPVGLFYAQPLFHPAFVFPLLSPFLLLGVWSLRKRPRSQMALILGWPLVMYLFLAGIAWENPRFSLGYLPPLAVLVGLGVQSIWHRPPNLPVSRLNSLIARYRNLYQPFLILYMALALIGSLAWSGRDLVNFSAANNAQIAAVRWMEAHVPATANVITFGVTLTMEHRTELNASDIYLHDPESMADLLESPTPLFLFLDLENINNQWAGLSPQQNYLWLQENGRLTEIDQYPPYTLFQVSAE